MFHMFHQPATETRCGYSLRCGMTGAEPRPGTLAVAPRSRSKKGRHNRRRSSAEQTLANLSSVAKMAVTLARGKSTAKRPYVNEAVSETTIECAVFDSCPSIWLPASWVALLRHFVLLASLANVIVFPGLRAFDGPVTQHNFPVWYAILWFLDGVLWLDIGCTFVTPVWHEGKRILDHRVIMRQYARGWLLYDVLCRMPWDLFLPGVDGPLAFDHGHLARLLLTPNALSLINDPFSKRKLEGRQTFVGPGRQLALLMFGSAVAMHWYASLWWLVGERLESDGRASWLTSSPRVNDWQSWPFQARYARAFDRALAFFIGEGDEGDAHDEAYLALFGRLGGIVWLAYAARTRIAAVGFASVGSNDPYLDRRVTDTSPRPW